MFLNMTQHTKSTEFLSLFRFPPVQKFFFCAHRGKRTLRALRPSIKLLQTDKLAAGKCGKRRERNDMQVKYSNGNGSIPFEIGITPEIHKDGDWYVAFCPEVPEANGQGRTREESIASLKEGVVSIMEDRRKDAAKHIHSDRCVPGPA